MVGILWQHSRFVFRSAYYEDRKLYFQIAQHAKTRGIPIVLDVERQRDGLESLLCLADYIITNATFPLEVG